MAALPPNPPPQLVTVYNLQPGDATPATPFKGLRARAQKKAAYALGVRAGVAWRYDRINNLLKREAPKLDRLYDFSALLLNDGRVMPPIVSQGTDSEQQESRKAEQTALVTWHIVAPAKIVTVSPTWQSYLIRHYKVDMKSVNAALLPKNRKERKLWQKAVLKGWYAGIKQANHLFQLALAHLSRDFLGVARFRLLARQGVVSVPRLSAGNLGVVINKNTMAVGAKVYRIVKDAKWQSRKHWKARPGS
jgi:defect-in-organelle-trafficking protein DotC